MFITEKQFYRIVGGLPLQLVQTHISERIRAEAAARKFAEEMGAEQFSINAYGKVSGVRFPGGYPNHPKEFTLPQRNRQASCRPKKISGFYKAWHEQKGYERPNDTIKRELKVPTSLKLLSPNGRDEFAGFITLGYPGHECDFLYPSQHGPFFMVTPDVLFAIQKIEDRGDKVAPECKAWTGEIDGCEPISEKQYKLEIAKWEVENENNT